MAKYSSKSAAQVIARSVGSKGKVPAQGKVNGHGLKHDNGTVVDELDADLSVVEIEVDDAFGYDDDDAVRLHEDDAGSVDATDDPVRMYLMQMGQIPLLNRAQEISSARRIEAARFRYRHSMLATDYVLQGAVEALEKVRDGQLRLDRTIEVSVTNTTEKKRIMKRIWPNLATLKHLLQKKLAKRKKLN